MGTHREDLGAYEVIVAGAGSAGVAAALAAAGNGARTLLVEQAPFLGGDLISGLPVLGCCNSLGEWIVGGVAGELFDACRERDGYLGCIFDWRTLWGVCVAPEVMRLAIAEALARRGVRVLLNAFAESVVAEGRRIHGLVVCSRSGRRQVRGRMFVDCTGDADLAFHAGTPTEKGANGQFQPVSLIFQMAGVDLRELLEFVRDHPEDLIVAENPIIRETPAQCAREIHRAGYPYFALSGQGPLLAEAICSGEIHPCAAIFTWPVSMSRGEVGLNTTRIANVDATDAEALSQAALPLLGQVEAAVRFLRRRLPGFERAELSRIAPRMGVRETRRIVGEHVLDTEEVLAARKSPEVIAKGGHHVDIHGAGTYQKRIPVRDGGSYDIPLGCLVPRETANLLVAGRCLSSTREANGSARVMGTCLATGQAAGTAAAMSALRDCADVRDLPINELQDRLRAQGAVLEGTR